MYFKWDDKYSVGVKLFDEQHKKLFTLMSNLRESMQGEDTKKVVGEVLDELIDYATTHFSDEEREMLEHGYPEYEVQREQHQDFLNQVNEFKTSYAAGKTMMTTEVMGFLVNWLTNHIAQTDKKYGVFFNDKGIY